MRTWSHLAGGGSAATRVTRIYCPPPPSLLVMRIVGHTWVGDYKRTLMSSARGVTLEKSFPTIDELVPADDDAELVKAIGPAKEK